jgi:hypothetical protein
LNATSTRFSTAHALACAGAFAALAVASAGGLAQTPDTALGRDLRGVLEFLEARNPELHAMALEADAARIRSGVASALPDRCCRWNCATYRSRSDAVAAVAGIALTQTFPLGDKRELGAPC